MATAKLMCDVKIKTWSKPILYLSVILFDYVPRFCFVISDPYTTMDGKNNAS